MLKILLMIIFLYNCKCGCCCQKCNNDYKELHLDNNNNNEKENKKDEMEEKKKKDDKEENNEEEIIENLKKTFLNEIENIEEPKNIEIQSLTKDIILKKLNITDLLINEINSSGNTQEKIDKIVENCNDIFNEEIYDYLPRCMILHINNNCSLESVFNILLHNPWFIKFFYLINTCVINDIKDECKVTEKICELVDYALNNPNFNDTIDAQKCYDISVAYYGSKYRDDDYCKENSLGSFHCGDYYFKIYQVYKKELNVSFNFFNNSKAPIYEDLCKTSKIVEFFKKDRIIIYVQTSTKIQINYPFRDIRVVEKDYHFSAYKFICGNWYNYDSLRVEKPTKMTIKQFLKDVIYKNIKDSNGYSIQMCLNTNFTGNDFSKINKIENLNNEVIKDLIKNKTISSYFYNCDVIGTIK